MLFQTLKIGMVFQAWSIENSKHYILEFQPLKSGRPFRHTDFRFNTVSGLV